MSRADPVVRFDTRKDVDFVIIGSGAAGGVLAKELATAGFEVVVLEQGPYRTAGDFSHDEIKVIFQREMTRHPAWSDPQTFRHSAKEKARVADSGPPPALYARGVGGSSVHFTANYWRMRPLDFRELMVGFEPEYYDPEGSTEFLVRLKTGAKIQAQLAWLEADLKRARQALGSAEKRVATLRSELQPLQQQRRRLEQERSASGAKYVLSTHVIRPCTDGTNRSRSVS